MLRPVGYLTSLPRPLWIVLAIMLAAFIWYASSRTWEGAENRLPGGFGNLLHLVLFGALAAFALLGQKRSRALSARAFWAITAAGAWGLVDEIHQFHVPGRSCSLFDLLDDVLGAGAAVVLISGVFFKKPGTFTYLTLALALLALGMLGALDFGDRWPSVDHWLARGLQALGAR